jgi:predicted nucleic acid-binding protein
MIVIADTSPINYLILIDACDLLSALFGTVTVPQGLVQELLDPASPAPVHEWANNLPSWGDVRVVGNPDPTLKWLGLGEREGISLARELGADLILLDDPPARTEAQKRHFRVTGTLGISREASLRKMINLRSALASLQSTSFYAPPSLIVELLEEDDQRKRTLQGSGE